MNAFPASFSQLSCHKLNAVPAITQPAVNYVFVAKGSCASVAPKVQYSSLEQARNIQASSKLKNVS